MESFAWEWAAPRKGQRFRVSLVLPKEADEEATRLYGRTDQPSLGTRFVKHVYREGTF